MRRKDIAWWNTIFVRMVVTFLLFLVPIYFLGINIFNSSKGMLSKEIFNSMKSENLYYLNNIENDIKRIKALQIDCLSDEDLNNLAYASTLKDYYNKTKAINRLQQRLATIKSSSPFVQNVSAHIPSINLTISAESTGTGTVEDMRKDVYVMCKKMPFGSDAQLMNWKGNLIIYTSFPFTLNSKKAPAFIIEVQLSKTALRNSLIQFDLYKGDKSLMASLSQNLLITNDNDGKTSHVLQEMVNKYSKKSSNDTIIVNVNKKQYLLIYTYSNYLGITLSRYIPGEMVFRPLRKFQLWYVAFSLLVLVIILLYSFSTYRFIHKPIYELVKSFKKVKKGDFNIKIEHKRKDEFGYLYGKFNEMVLELKTLIDQVYKQTILTQKAELKQLQSQINPHFLYNNFFILQRRINRGDYENAQKFCESLGVYFKFITRSALDDVTLDKEVEHARIYAEIQAMRFSNRIIVEFAELPVEFNNIMVPKLILQPIIENAFMHGLEEKAKGGVLKIEFNKKDNILMISIEDNGDMLTDQQFKELKDVLEGNTQTIENTGVVNIHKRLRLTMGDRSGVIISRGTFGGLRVEVNIEIKES